MSREPLIELQDVKLVYRALPALRDISWSFEPGQQWACLGPNGAGKTSLANVLSRQATHFSGLLQRSQALEAGGVAYVCFEQARALCDRDRKLDDSEQRADASDPGTLVRHAILGSAATGADFQHWVERLHIEHILDRGLRYISTGEMRKTLLIRAILSEPALLILDSPLDGLDLATQEEMRQVIGELLRSPLKLLVLCRQLEDVPPAVSHLLVLDQGQVFAQGERGTMLKQSRVQALMAPPAVELAMLPPPAPRELSPDDPPWVAPDVIPCVPEPLKKVSRSSLRYSCRASTGRLRSSWIFWRSSWRESGGRFWTWS